jgi:hypothetical protein
MNMVYLMIWHFLLHALLTLVMDAELCISDALRGTIFSKKLKLLIQSIMKIPGFLVTKKTLGAWLAANVAAHTLISTLNLPSEIWWRTTERIAIWTMIWACTYTFTRRLSTQDKWEEKVTEILAKSKRQQENLLVRRKDEPQHLRGHGQTQNPFWKEYDTQQSSEFWLHKTAMSSHREFIWQKNWEKGVAEALKRAINMMERSSSFWFRKVYLTICILVYATKYRERSNVATQTWLLGDFVIIQSTLWTIAHILALRLLHDAWTNWRSSALWFGELYLNTQILTRREDTHVANDWRPTIMATTQTMIWTTCISIL